MLAIALACRPGRFLGCQAVVSCTLLAACGPPWLSSPPEQWDTPVAHISPTRAVARHGNSLCRHPLRVVFPFQDNAIARAKAALPRYTWPHHTPFPPPIYVVSLKRSAKRRAAIAAQMESRGINFTFFDAVDGVQQLLPDADVGAKVCVCSSSRSRGRPLRFALSGCANSPRSVSLQVKWYASGARWRGYATESTGGFWHRKMGCDLSHFRLMHQMLAGEVGVPSRAQGCGHACGLPSHLTLCSCCLCRQ